MPFSADERAILAGGVGLTVIQQLEQVGVENLPAKAIEAARAHAPAGV